MSENEGLQDRLLLLARQTARLQEQYPETKRRPADSLEDWSRRIRALDLAAIPADLREAAKNLKQFVWTIDVGELMKQGMSQRDAIAATTFYVPDLGMPEDN